MATAVTGKPGIGSIRWSNASGGTRTGRSCSLCVPPRAADRTASLWSSLSWLEAETAENVFSPSSFTAWVGGGESRLTYQTLYNSDCCCNIELFNCSFNKKITLIAALSRDTVLRVGRDLNFGGDVHKNLFWTYWKTVIFRICIHKKMLCPCAYTNPTP